MDIRLAVDGPLDVDATLARFRLWGDDPANRLSADTFRRVLRHEGRLVPYGVRWRGPVDAVELEVTAADGGPAVAPAIVREVRHVFGLDVDLPGFYRMAEGDAVLAPLTRSLHGLRPTLAPTGFEMLVSAILAQQVNLTFAAACRARLVVRHGTPVSTGSDTLYAFPEPSVLARLTVRQLRALKLSTRKAEYIRGLARAVLAGLDLETLRTTPNGEVVARLTALRGLGSWTADWFLARCAGRGDVCPAGDLAVRKAFAHFVGRGRILDEAAIRRRARRWGAYQSLAVHYLLAGLRRLRPVAGDAA